MKNSPGKWISVVFAFCVLHFFGGNMYAKSSVPYQIKGELKLNSAAEGSGCNFEGLFSNLADKAVNSFTIVFYVLRTVIYCYDISRAVKILLTKFFYGCIRYISAGVNSLFSCTDCCVICRATT